MEPDRILADVKSQAEDGESVLLGGDFLVSRRGYLQVV